MPYRFSSSEPCGQVVSPPTNRQETFAVCPTYVVRRVIALYASPASSVPWPLIGYQPALHVPYAAK